MNEHPPALEAMPEPPVPADLTPPRSPAPEVPPEAGLPRAAEVTEVPVEPSRRHTPARRRKREEAARKARQEIDTPPAPATGEAGHEAPAVADTHDAGDDNGVPLPSDPSAVSEAAVGTVRAQIDVFGARAANTDFRGFDRVLVAANCSPTWPADRPSEPLPASLDDLDTLLRAAGSARIAIVVPDTPLENGPGRALLSALGPDQVRLHASVGALQTALGRIGFTPEEVTTLRIARIGAAGLEARLRRGRLFAIDPEPLPPQAIGQMLEDAGLHQARVWVVSPRPEAPVSAMMAFELTDAPGAFPSDSLVVAYTVGADGSRRDWPGIPASEIPGALPEAVRLLALAWLQPGSEECGWCIEGSQPALALDWARERPEAAVFCIGCAEDTLAAALHRHGAGDHAMAVAGGSFHSLEPLTDPNVVFIRAGDEFTQQVRTAWTRLRPGGRMVVAAEDEHARLELMQFAHRNRPGLWQDLSVASGDAEARPIRLAAPRSVRLMGWTKPPRG